MLQEIILNSWHKFLFEQFLVAETMSLLHLQSKVCMAPYHLQSKVSIAQINGRSKFVDFALHIVVSKADFAPHMEGSHADFAPHEKIQDQKNWALQGFFPQFLYIFL